MPDSHYKKQSFNISLHLYSETVLTVEIQEDVFWFQVPGTLKLESVRALQLLKTQLRFDIMKAH